MARDSAVNAWSLEKERRSPRERSERRKRMGRKKKRKREQVIASGAKTSRRDHSLSNYQQIILLVTQRAPKRRLLPTTRLPRLHEVKPRLGGGGEYKTTSLGGNIILPKRGGARCQFLRQLFNYTQTKVIIGRRSRAASYRERCVEQR